MSLFCLHCTSLFLCQWQYFCIIHIALRLEFFSFFLIHFFVAYSSPSSATFAYTLLLMHDLAGYKSHFSADTLIQIYPWVVDNFNCYQQEAGPIPIQTPLSRNEWSSVTSWKIKVAKGIIWLELSWQIFTVMSGIQHPMFRKKYIEYYAWEGKK